MSVLYCYTRIEDDIEASGEAKKAKMQVAALEANGVKTQLVYHNRYVKNNKILIRLPFYPIYSNKFINQIIDKMGTDIDVIYIRKYVFDKSFIRLLKKIKAKNSKVRIILEVPTYPYDKEWSSLIDLPLITKDKLNRKKLKRYVDRIVTFSEDCDIWGIKCLQISNGIDCDAIRVRSPKDRRDNKIELLGVATLEKWHGYDRVLRGIRTYYNGNPKIEVVFNIVGGGAELNNLKELVKNLGIQKYVIFHGRKSGEDLSNMFDICDIGVGSLGMYRIGLENGYTLKLREYMARGIPFLYGYTDKLVEKSESQFIYKIKNCNDEVDINKLNVFYNSFKNLDKAEIAAEMATYAREHFSWKEQMSLVAKYIKEEN